MAIEFPCPHCSQLLRVGDDSAGKTAKCPKCEGLAKIPGDPGGTFTPPGGSVGAPLPSSFGPPSPSPFGETSAAQNPFSDFGNASRGYSGASPKPGNVFAPAGEINPYSSPAPTFDALYRTGYEGAGRAGLPWDSRGRSIGTWWETLTMILGSANNAFRQMHISGGFGKPIGYAMIGLAIGSLGNLILNLGMLGLLAAGGIGGEQLAMQMAQQVASAVLTPLLGATLMCLIQAGVMHVCLIMVGGEKNGYEATFRVCAYNMGVFGAFNAVPVIGPCVGFFWQIVTTIIGLAEAHETTGGKAAAAYFIALLGSVLVCVGVVFVVALIIGTMAGGLR